MNQMNNFSVELSESIEGLYNTFAKYALNLNMLGSPLYPELAKWNRTLSVKRLRELSVEDLRIYYHKAMTTWGNTFDFKHCLPLLLELLSELPADFDAWVLLDKLNYGKYESWPDDEKAAIHRFLLAFWHKLLTEESDVVNARFGEYFSAIANVYPQLDEMLEIWLSIENQISVQRLAVFICSNQKNLLKKQLLPGYEDMVHQGKVFLKWLRTAVVLSKLRQTKAPDCRPHIALELTPVLQQLEC
jgi:hypothetical protein